MPRRAAARARQSLALCLGGHAQACSPRPLPPDRARRLCWPGRSRHETHGLRRVIVVLPYLSILDQTLDAIRRRFPPGPGYHRGRQPGARCGRRGERGRLLAENWDAPS